MFEEFQTLWACHCSIDWKSLEFVSMPKPTSTMIIFHVQNRISKKDQHQSMTWHQGDYAENAPFAAVGTWPYPDNDGGAEEAINDL